VAGRYEADERSEISKISGDRLSGIVEQGNAKYRKGDEVFGMTSIFKGGASQNM